MPANSCRKRWHERIERKRRHRISDLGDRKPRQIGSHTVNRCFPLSSRQRPPDVGQKLQCLNEMLAAASHAQRHAALKQRPLGCVVINCLQPADHAAIARMLHDDGDLAQFFEDSLRRQQLKFDFRLFTRSYSNCCASRIGHDWLLGVQW
jgi:hypothetical protein